MSRRRQVGLGGRPHACPMEGVPPWRQHGVEGRCHGPCRAWDRSCPSVNTVLSSRRTRRTSPGSPGSNPLCPTLLPACMPLPGHVLPTANRTNTPQRPRARHRTESVAASAPVRPHYGLIRRGGTSSERLSYFPTLTQPRRASSTSPFPAPGHTAAKEDHSPLH